MICISKWCYSYLFIFIKKEKKEKAEAATLGRSLTCINLSLQSEMWVQLVKSNFINTILRKMTFTNRQLISLK